MLHRWWLRRAGGDYRNETIWLTVYADLITNLALVFLALYGLTLMGDDALSRAVQSMKIEDIRPLQESEDPGSFDAVAISVRRAIQQTPDVMIREDIGAIRIGFGESILFESGRAAAKPSADKVLTILSDVLRDVPYTIVVEGHTDSLPLVSKKYRDNWELSLMRAMSVVQILQRKGLSADKMAAAAYGPYRPCASNLTSSGRALNRRVEIALFKDFRYPAVGDKIEAVKDGGS